MLLNSGLNDFVMSTAKSEYIALKVRTVSDFVPKRYSVSSGLRDIVYRHEMLCDILELIDYSYTLQVLGFLRSKIGYATVGVFYCFFRYSIVPHLLLIPLLHYHPWQLGSNSTCYNGVYLEARVFSVG
jgi:hypothetical protein